MTIRLLIIFALAFCAFGEEFSNLTETASGYQLVGNRVVINKKSRDNKFVWGIILREHEGGGAYYSSPVRTTVTLRGGGSLELATNELTISGNGTNTTHKMKPYTIYLLGEDLSLQSSDDLSGIEFVPKQVWSRGHGGEPGGYVTVYDLNLPKDIYNRFKSKK